MQTTSHFLMSALLGSYLKRRDVQIKRSALLWGSITPDLPLFALTFGYWGYRAWFDPIQPGESPFGERYDALYFENPFWIASHNFFHAPPMIAGLLLLGYWFGVRQGHSWGQWALWFGLGCGLHSLIDIPTHANDGPLLLFPFNWEWRYNSPLSYWDPAFYGNYFAIFELLFTLGVLSYFGVRWWRSRAAVRADLPPPEQPQPVRDG